MDDGIRVWYVVIYNVRMCEIHYYVVCRQRHKNVPPATPVYFFKINNVMNVACFETRHATRMGGQRRGAA